MGFTTKMSDLNFNDNLFIPMVSGSMIDSAFSTEGGIMSATNMVIAGAPGVGKTTVLLDILGDLQAKGKKCLFISGEMNSIDMVGYVRRFPKIKDLPILFMGDYADENPEEVIESTLNEGWDCVLIDSMAELQDAYQSYFKGSNEGQANRILKMLEKYNKSHYTSFLIIQQMTKGGVFVGSNKLKHMTTAFADLKFDEIGNRYMQFTKNRRGGSMNKFMYNLDTHNKVNWLYEEAA